MLGRLVVLTAMVATMAGGLVACAADPEGTASGSAGSEADRNLSEPPQGQWRLVELAGSAAVDQTEVTLAFDGAGGVAGIGGCNRYTGSYEMSDGVIQFGPIASTKRACPEPIMQQEMNYFAALSGASHMRMDGNVLLIVDAKTNSSLRFESLTTATGS